MTNAIVIILCLILLYILIKLLRSRVYFSSFYLSTFLCFIALLVLVFAIVLDPKQSFDAASQGINLCMNVVFPSLFPFFVATYMLNNLGFVHILGVFLEPVMRPVFNVPGSGSFAFAMGIISGYPVGAKTAADLWEKKLCTTAEAERLLTFCNNSGPLFILGAVSVGMFNRPDLGSLLFLSHFLASISVGLCFRFYKSHESHVTPYGTASYGVAPKNKGARFKAVLTSCLKDIKKLRKEDGRNAGEIFGDAIQNAVNLLLAIGGFIIFFSVLIRLLTNLKIIWFIARLLGLFLVPLGISSDLLSSIASGFFEITTGIRLIASQQSVSLVEKLVTTSLILGWAGLSVHCQVISLVGKTRLKISPYMLGKALQGILSAIYTFLLLKFSYFSTHVSFNTATPTPVASPASPLAVFFTSVLYLGNMLFFITILSFLIALMSSIHQKKD